MNDTLSVAVVQLTSTDDVGANVQAVLSRLAGLPSGVQLVSLPENALFMRVHPGRSVEYLKLSDFVFEKLSEWAQRHHCAIHIGATPLRDDGQNYNATVIIEKDGRIHSPYKKIHLFDVDLDQERAIRESDAFVHGARPAVWTYENWTFGLSICYDVRFSELYQFYARHSVDCILVPSAFTVPTGKAHWEILLRARAIESQCYVLAAAQGGQHSTSKATYGHSLVVDPWGVVLGDSSGETVFCQLEKSAIKRVRKQIPMAKHRRL